MMESNASQPDAFQIRLARFRQDLKGPVIQILTVNGQLMKDLEGGEDADLLDELQAIQWAGQKLSKTIDEVFGPAISRPEDLDVSRALRNLRSLLKPIRKTTKELWSRIEAAKKRDILVRLGQVAQAAEEIFGAMDDRLVATFLGLPAPPPESGS